MGLFRKLLLAAVQPQPQRKPQRRSGAKKGTAKSTAKGSAKTGGTSGGAKARTANRSASAPTTRVRPPTGTGARTSGSSGTSAGARPASWQSYGPPIANPAPARRTRRSQNPAVWLGPDSAVTLSGRVIRGGMVYFGGYLPATSARFAGGPDPALIDPARPSDGPATGPATRCPTGRATAPSPPAGRAGYLDWLCAGRNDPRTYIGYVFLYFYGLERRVLVDCSRPGPAWADLPAVRAEVVRLLSIYGRNASFHGYATGLLAVIDLMTAQRPDRPPVIAEQIMSLIAQHSGVKANEAYSALCGQGPFENVSTAVFAALLRSMAARDLIAQQQSDGLLLLGESGERFVNHYSFYAAFASHEEYRLIAEGRLLGGMPVDSSVCVGDALIFAGRRWRIVAIDDRGKTIELESAPGGRLPKFQSGVVAVGDEVRRRMYELYRRSDVPRYLDRRAADLLAQGRDDFDRYRLHARPLIEDGGQTHLLVWSGDRTVSTVALALADAGLESLQAGMVLTVYADAARVTAAVTAPAADAPPEPEQLARRIGTKVRDKWDGFLDDGLLELSCARRDVDVPGAWRELGRLAGTMPGTGYGGIRRQVMATSDTFGRRPIRIGEDVEGRA